MANTWFQKEEKRKIAKFNRKITCSAGKYERDIDFVPVSKKYRKYVRDVKVIP